MSRCLRWWARCWIATASTWPSSAGRVRCTIRTYLWNARLFVLAACGDDVNRIGALTPGDVARFVTAVSEGRRASTVNTIVVGVRALLRYLYAVGLIATPLAQATPWLARGRVSTLPRTTVPGAARQLLASFDRTTVAGARDFAIVTLMSRLGLRLGEVVDMELDDVDWRRGELLVRSKGGWRDPLPVPVDVGDALTAYLVIRGRDVRWRQVFLRIDPPGPMSRTTVLAAIRRGLRPCRAGGHVLAPATAHAGGRPAPRRRRTARDRPGAAPPSPFHHGHVRQGRHRGAGRCRPAVAGEPAMSPLEIALGDYLAVRRAFGYRLQDVERHLVRFVSHLDANGIDTVTVAVAVGWATSTATASTAKDRVSAIRGFTRYLQALDPAHEVLPRGVVPGRVTRAVPHLYSEDDITALMAAARSLQPASWAATVETVIGLLWATGMRVGEVFRLNVADFDPDDHVLTVWLSKFGKSRLVPLSASTSAALDRYRRTVARPRRACCSPHPIPGAGLRQGSTGTSHVCWTRRGSPPASGAVHARTTCATASLCEHSSGGIATAPTSRRCCRACPPTSVTSNRGSTYWYLSAAPELMALAAERLERHDGAVR